MITITVIGFIVQRYGTTIGPSGHIKSKANYSSDSFIFLWYVSVKEKVPVNVYDLKRGQKVILSFLSMYIRTLTHKS